MVILTHFFKELNNDKLRKIKDFTKLIFHSESQTLDSMWGFIRALWEEACSQVCAELSGLQESPSESYPHQLS